MTHSSEGRGAVASDRAELAVAHLLLLELVVEPGHLRYVEARVAMRLRLLRGRALALGLRARLREIGEVLGLVARGTATELAGQPLLELVVPAALAALLLTLGRVEDPVPLDCPCGC